MKKIIIIGLLTCSLFLLNGCAENEDTSKEDEQLTFYTSIYPVQYATERIAGILATVKSIYPPGVDSHTYEPTSREITAIARGDAFIYLGGEMEGFATAIQKALQKQPILLTELGSHEALFDGDEEHGEDEVDHSHHDHDPHVWLDPLKMIEIGEIILTDLTASYPAHTAEFAANFAQFKTDMLALDAAFLSYFKDNQERYIIVTHGAYEYWAKRYNIIQIPIRGRSSSDEPSQKDLVDVAKLAAEKNIHYVLFEQNNEDYVSTIILEHLQAEKRYLHNLEVLTAEDIENGADYLSLMMRNLDVLIEATGKGENEDGRSSN